MESFELYSAVRRYYVFRDVWEPSVGEKLVARREFDNRFDKFAVKVLNGEETVGQLPREYSRIAWYFLAPGGSISVEVSGHRRHCKQLCGGMEIPCWVKFTCSRKAMLNRLKDLLTKKVQSLCKLTQKNGSFRSHQTRKSNDQCVMWYSFVKFLLICCTVLYRLLNFLLNLLIYANLRHGV